ncbi:4Fe-4S binding protein [Brevibacillus sp. SYSU BS000544]|uniref:4Fe-4S binding protein n=1 Tax=Brevibacillus sp. SYSU BS000544 TaxID=3416443 RepID=UPI003CE48221
MNGHVMPGIPTYIFTIGVAIILALSFYLLVRYQRVSTTSGSGYWTFDLLRFPWVSRLIRSRKTRLILQMFTVFLFLFIIATGLFGIQDASLNLSTVLTWTIWWIVLVLFILFAGKLWCYICPWDAIATWIDKLHLHKVRKSVFSLSQKWPKFWRNIYFATGLFLLLTWLELGWGVTSKPAVTAYLALVILFMSIFATVIFDRKSFCRYACLIGRISGLYALISPIEVRARDKNICATCTTKDCYNGNQLGYACPTYQYLGSMEKNTYCITCMECVKTCTKNNATVQLRPFGVDLLKVHQSRKDEAALILIMLAMTSFHGLTMTPVWYTFTDWIEQLLGINYTMAFTIGMAVSLVVVWLYYYLTIYLTHIVMKKIKTLKEIFIKQAYSLLPIALFYHLAHNLMHFSMEGGKVFSVISDPFGFGWNLFGTRDLGIGPLLSMEAIWLWQVVFVLVGHVWSLIISHKVAAVTYGENRSFKDELPMVIAMIVYSVISLYLIAQPMEMRTSM